MRNGAVCGGSPPITNTFVGSIVVANLGSVTNALPTGFSLNGTPIPYAGNLAISGQNGGDTNMDFGSPLTKQSQILTWDPVAQGLSIIAQKVATPATWGATVTIKPTDGFFVNNKNGPATNAVETLNLQ